jgi:hypothetical protein
VVNDNNFCSEGPVNECSAYCWNYNVNFRFHVVSCLYAISGELIFIEFHIGVICPLIQIFFTWWNSPQQMLRTHRSLKASCATLWWRWRWRWAVVYQVVQVMEHQRNEIDRGKPTTRRKTCPSATLSTTKATWTDPGSNPGLRSGRPATNRLSHGTALSRFWFKYLLKQTFFEQRS